MNLMNPYDEPGYDYDVEPPPDWHICSCGERCDGWFELYLHQAQDH